MEKENMMVESLYVVTQHEYEDGGDDTRVRGVYSSLESAERFVKEHGYTHSFDEGSRWKPNENGQMYSYMQIEHRLLDEDHV